MTTLGLFYSIYVSVLWPAIPLVVDAKFEGTAFGIANCVQNLGLLFLVKFRNEYRANSSGIYFEQCERYQF